PSKIHRLIVTGPSAPEPETCVWLVEPPPEHAPSNTRPTSSTNGCQRFLMTDLPSPLAPPTPVRKSFCPREPAPAPFGCQGKQYLHGEIRSPVAGSKKCKTDVSTESSTWSPTCARDWGLTRATKVVSSGAVAAGSASSPSPPS